MQINVGKIDKNLKVCTTCRQKAPPITECVLPADKYGHYPQYFDLCSACISVVEALPEDYLTLDTPLASLVAPRGFQPAPSPPHPVRESSRSRTRSKTARQAPTAPQRR
jgi:hypothetical protein